jgi:hypothetical protein
MRGLVQLIYLRAKNQIQGSTDEEQRYITEYMDIINKYNGNSIMYY